MLATTITLSFYVKPGVEGSSSMSTRIMLFAANFLNRSKISFLCSLSKLTLIETDMLAKDLLITSVSTSAQNDEWGDVLNPGY